MLSDVSYLMTDKTKLVIFWQTEQSSRKSRSFYKKLLFQDPSEKPLIVLEILFYV